MSRNSFPSKGGKLGVRGWINWSYHELYDSALPLWQSNGMAIGGIIWGTGFELWLCKNIHHLPECHKHAEPMTII